MRLVEFTTGHGEPEHSIFIDVTKIIAIEEEYTYPGWYTLYTDNKMQFFVRSSVEALNRIFKDTKCSGIPCHCFDGYETEK